MIYDIRQLQTSADRCLQQARGYLLSKTLKAPEGWGLQQFLDEIRLGDSYVGIYGTSCGVITLRTCGESIDSPVIQNYRSWLITHQENDGGWTLSTFRSKDVLTTSTCYVLNALNEAGESYASPVIQDGLRWLQRTANPDRGWGMYENDQSSKTTPTSNAIIALSRFPEMLRTQTSSESVNWILKSRNVDHGWGFEHATNISSTLAHTSLATLALLANGYPTYSAEIRIQSRGC